MAETIALTVPVVYVADATIRISRVVLDVEAGLISIHWLGNNQVAARADYPTPAVNNPLGSLQPSGTTLLHQLNTANFSVTSLVKKVLQQLQADGYVAAGVISGTAS